MYRIIFSLCMYSNQAQIYLFITYNIFCDMCTLQEGQIKLINICSSSHTFHFHFIFFCGENPSNIFQKFTRMPFIVSNCSYQILHRFPELLLPKYNFVSFDHYPNCHICDHNLLLKFYEVISIIILV